MKERPGLRERRLAYTLRQLLEVVLDVQVLNDHPSLLDRNVVPSQRHRLTLHFGTRVVEHSMFVIGVVPRPEVVFREELFFGVWTDLLELVSDDRLLSLIDVAAI